MLSGLLLYRFPLFPARSIIRTNLDLYNYLKVSLLNLKMFSFRFQYLRQKGIWVFDDWSDNYFHWTFDVLSKLIALRQSDNCTTILVPEKLLKFPYVVDTLNTLDYKIIPLKSGITYVVKEIVAQANIQYFRKDILFQLRATVFKKLPVGNTQQVSPNIYISRSKAARRKILNEKELLNILSNYNFHTVYLEEMTWQQQVQMFRNANLVVGMHGAGLSNMLYSETMRGVIELRPSSSQNGLFRLLAGECSVTYREIQVAAPDSNIHDESFRLDDESLNMVNTYIRELMRA